MFITRIAADMIYRASFLSGLIAILVYTFINLITIILLVNALGGIVGWNTYERIILLGCRWKKSKYNCQSILNQLPTGAQYLSVGLFCLIKT